MNSLLPDAALAELERCLGSRVRTDHSTRSSVSIDASDVEASTPAAVIDADSVEVIEESVRWARRWCVPLVPRGAGTGKVGGALCPANGVLIRMTGMSRIRDISTTDLVAVVEPGVVTGDLHRAVESQGLFYGPDPGALDRSTLGGNLAHNAGGPRAVKYGVTRDWVRGLEAVLGTGERVRTGGRTRKQSSGYDLTNLLVGSEGTLGIITEAVVRLIPRPPSVTTWVLRCQGPRAESTGLGTVGALLGSGILPRTCEFVDAAAAAAVQDLLPWDGTDPFLLVEVDGTPEACAADSARLLAVARGQGIDVFDHASTDEDRARLWAARRQVSPRLRAEWPWKVSEDVTVPIGQVEALSSRVRDIGRRHGFRTAAYGHAGDGNLHVNLLCASRAERERCGPALGELLRAALDLGGTLSGEHGIGMAKQPYFHWEHASILHTHRRVKAAFDPDGILNPGKIWAPPG